MENKLRTIRTKAHLTQSEAANLLGISLRSYKSYELEEGKMNGFRYDCLIMKLNQLTLVDEEHGVLRLDDINKVVSEVLKEYKDVKFCYLFGSYAKGYATEKSDVDLLISSGVKGMAFYGLVENLRNKLGKQVDLLDINQLKDNVLLIEEVLKDGIKIFEQ